MYAITLSEYMCQQVKWTFGMDEKVKYDAIWFMSSNLELTNTVRDFFETLDKKDDKDILMSLLMVKYLGFIDPNEKLFQVISLDNEYTDYTKTFADVLYANDFVYLEGIMNSRSDDKNVAIQTHNKYFNSASLNKIKRVLGNDII